MSRSKEPRFQGKVTPERSKAMGRIRGTNTSIEIKLRKALWNKGIRYRKNYKAVPGSPDIAITKYKVAVFVDGEFWHGEDWENRKKKLKSNREYWIEKIEENIERDKRNDTLLVEMGWIPLHFWEKDIKRNIQKCVDKIIDAVQIQFSKSVEL